MDKQRKVSNKLNWQIAKKNTNHVIINSLTNNHTGWLQPSSNVCICPSTNFNSRPADSSVELIVIHSISLPENKFGKQNIENICNFFTNKLNCQLHPSFASLHGVQVSAHFLLCRNGKIIQFVNTHQRAWHAGQSKWLERSNCNDFSLGIELEGSDFVAYTSRQYARLTSLIKSLRQIHPNIKAITGHCHIAPGRKSDPGEYFLWSKLANIFPDLAVGEFI